jgi:AcrR family transcriptional regulator
MLTMSTPGAYDGWDVITPAKRRRKQPHRYHHGDLRRALLDEALRTIRTNGVEALTLRTAGKKLGVSRSALYRHFADKEALLAAVATEGFRMLREDLVKAWQRAGRGRTGFDAMGMAYVGFAIANPSHYRVMFGRAVIGKEQHGDPDLLREGHGAFQVLVDAIIEQQRDGLVRMDDPRQLAQFIWATVHGVAMLAIDGRLGQEQTDSRDVTRFAVDRLRTGLAST